MGVWKFEAPGARRMTGGQGVTMTERYPATKPAYRLGIPESWYSIDLENPPVFESQAEFLERRGLIGSAERKKADFSPETVKQSGPCSFGGMVPVFLPLTSV